MTQYTVTGSFRARRGYWQPFVIRRDAETEERARERVLSDLGSRHRVTRELIRIESVAAPAP
ncbi:MAG TPA: 50S ribosomal protein L18Ae [Thermoplasmata archaeon]|nr:50S ribosomal protein L18Ae [Thermoplasmata archaeon]